MVRCKVAISHGHFDIGVAEDSLQHQNVATVHHEVAGEGMAQHMGTLASWQLDTSSPYSLLELGIAIIK